jgi:hypothetical protein
MKSTDKQSILMMQISQTDVSKNDNINQPILSIRLKTHLFGHKYPFLAEFIYFYAQSICVN